MDNHNKTVTIEKEEYERLLERDWWLRTVESTSEGIYCLPLEYWEKYDDTKDIFGKNNKSS